MGSRRIYGTWVSGIGMLAVLALAGCASATGGSAGGEGRAPPSTAADAPPSTIDASLVFDGVTVVDVEQGKLVPDQRVAIADNRIAAVGSASTVKLPKAAQVVDARGKYLIPGLWDMHVHPGMTGAGIAGRGRGVPVTQAVSYMLFITNGVTGFRGAWSKVPLDTMVQLRREILAGDRIGPPRQIFSGVAVNARRSCTRQENGWTGHACVTAGDSADVENLVQGLKAAGADAIKTYNLDPGTYFMLVAAARRAGMVIGGHSSKIDPLAAADSGAHMLEHVGPEHVGKLDALCFTPGKASVEGCRVAAELFRQNNTWAVPTLSSRSIRWFKKASPQIISNLMVKAVSNFWDDPTSTYNPTWLKDHVPMPLPADPDTLRFGYLKIPMEVGLPMLSGGDTMADEAGYKTHSDMAIMVDRGLTPLAALQTATLNPAKMLGATDSLGTVAPGKLADLVLLDANPLADITNTTTIRAVVANGRYFDRTALNRLLLEIKLQTKGTP